MSVHKESATELAKRGLTYTTLSSDVIQSITNPDALAIWTYLQKQSEGWNIYRKNLKNHFGIGEKRLSDALRYLREAELIWSAQVRGADGKLQGTKLICESLPASVNEAIFEAMEKALPNPPKTGASVDSTETPINRTLGKQGPPQTGVHKKGSISKKESISKKVSNIYTGNQPSAKTEIPETAKPTEKMLDRASAYWQRKGANNLDPFEEFERFKIFHISKGSKMASWPAAWQSWYANPITLGHNNPPKPVGTRKTSLVEDLTDTSWARQPDHAT
jgi:hypothetical protein